MLRRRADELVRSQGHRLFLFIRIIRKKDTNSPIKKNGVSVGSYLMSIFILSL